MRPTIREVAKRAGVSLITVSRVVNNSGYVSSETRARVEEAIQELGYIPNNISRSLRLKKTNVIALIVSDITNPFWTTITRGIEDACHEQGLNVILCNTDESPEKLDMYVNVLLQKRVDGFLIAPTTDDTDTLISLVEQEVPLVFIDRHPQTIRASIVRGDSEVGAYKLTEYLISLGHSRIAILSGPEKASTSQQRTAGYERACQMHQIAVDPSLIFCGEYNQEHGYHTTLNIFEQIHPKPTAIFAGNSLIAAGVFKAVYELGLKIPADVSVAAFDDLTFRFTPEPFLTVVDQFPYEMGYTAAQLLLKQIGDQTKTTYEEIVLPVELIVRHSCREVGRDA
jgi:LacI family transcriptional regulator